MPWTLGDALGHTKKAKSTAAKSQWAATANSVLKKTGDEGKAVRIANAAVKKRTHSPKSKKSKPVPTRKTKRTY